MSSPVLRIFILLLVLSPIAPAFSGESDKELCAHELLRSTLWTQTAVEHDVLCVQAYKLASIQLDRAIDDPSWTAAVEQKGSYELLPPAVILDVDETVLDNSPFQAWLVEKNARFDIVCWNKWVQEEKAEVLPGAKEFLIEAAQRNVEVFFVTNRGADVEEATVNNLARVLGMPVAKEAVLCKNERPGWSSDKTSRRAEIAKTHRILLLIGDDFNDFIYLGKLSALERLKQAQATRKNWGTKWIQLPNPMYGHWESALLGDKHGASDAERRAIQLKALQTRE